MLRFSKFIMSVFVPVAIFPITFFLQLKLGYEVSLFPLYMVSIAALSWEFGVLGGFLSVLLATGLWLGGNLLTGFVYTYDWAIYYNTAARLAVFLAVAFFVLMFRRVTEHHRLRMESLRALLNVCHGCGSVQGGDGNWIQLNQLSSLKLNAPNECPACTKAAQEQLVREPGSGLKPVMARQSVDCEACDKEGGSDGVRPWRPGDPERRKRVRRAEDQ